MKGQVDSVDDKKSIPFFRNAFCSKEKIFISFQ